jgi:2-amino-4-hydroxy-6-hydroxymethyldihydropteridine diphosphokinase
MRWIPAYVALGSNLANPGQQVERAFGQLAALDHTRLIARSHCYRTRPMGPQDQPDFINAVAGLLTSLEARELLRCLKDIERDMGREPPPVRWGARLIDLDLLLYDALTLSEPGLDLPHPGIHERNFVLYPLAEIAPEIEIPGRGRVAQLAHRLGSGGLERLDQARTAGQP